MTIKYSGDNITFSDSSIQSTAATGFGFKNRIINGDMRIDQRNAGASVSTASGTSVYTLDRWAFDYSQTSKATIQQNAGSVTPPSGFTNYLGITSSSAYSVGSTDYFVLNQRIEGVNIADLAWGTASAQPITLSFWVRSSLTGTFGGALRNNAANRSYPFSYTINSASTWEQKTITVPGDTTGTWLTSTGIGMFVYFGLGVGATYSGTAGAWAGTNYLSVTGATSVVGTNGATFYITGVDLRKGSVGAYSNGQNDFDYRPYSTELALCQRYFEVVSTTSDGDGNRYLAAAWTTADANVFIPFKVTKRSAATVSISDAGSVYNGSWNTATSASVIGSSTIGTTVDVVLTGGYTARSVYFIRSQGITASAEL